MRQSLLEKMRILLIFMAYPCNNINNNRYEARDAHFILSIICRLPVYLITFTESLFFINYIGFHVPR